MFKKYRQQGFYNSESETAKFSGSPSVQLLCLIEDLCLECPTIAKPKRYQQ